MHRFFLTAFIAAVLSFSVAGACNAQTVRYVTGKITDAKTGEPLPYVTVYVKLPNHQRKAAPTDFDGIYKLGIPADAHPDSIFASYVSYITGQKPLSSATKTVDFQLYTDVKMLKDVVITPHSYVNPALEIMRNVIAHKDSNNFDKLSSYHYEAYKRIDLAVNNFSEGMRKRKFMKQLTPIMDSLSKMQGSDGQPLLPIFMSESISNIYNTTRPDQKTEEVLSTRSKGVGIEDQALISQIVSTGFQQYNFYHNYLRLAGKDFISPLADGWRILYNYELAERSEMVHGIECYRLTFSPKRSHDLAFNGVMWITHDGYALLRIDLTLTPDANLDFFKKIKIQQEMVQPQGTNAWLPEKTRVVVQIDNLLKSTPGFIGRFYMGAKKFEINKPYTKELFKEPLTTAKGAIKDNDAYWNQSRYDTLTAVEKRTYATIDTVRNLPVIRSYADIAAMVINGYYRVGKFSFGPYLYTYSRNDLQGSVVRIGGITNKYFSNSVILGGYMSYAFLNKKLNYGASFDYIIDRKPWTQAGVSYSHDIEQTGYQFENFSPTNGIFRASVKNGSITKRGPFLQNDFTAYFQRDLASDIRAKISYKHRTFDPLYDFAYLSRSTGQIYNDYQVSEAIAEVQWTPGRRQLQSDQINKRILINNGDDNPIITARFTQGAKLFDGDFAYQKFAANITQKVHMGFWGKGEYSITGVFIPSTLPYPLLENHRYNFNTMRFLEFTSDKYIAINYQQHFDGLITNSLPLLKYLNLRTVGDFNLLEGTLSEENNTRRLRDGTRRYDRSLHGIPYFEVGYGVENILKFLRFDVLYRINHNDHPDQDGVLPSRIAFKTSVQFRL
ncbi:DUF5686 and carboxypeptidase-like regulatory domain-containing protein [Mucilaginibacter ginkgonis]|uniref:Carboxypeptidase-like regulatory domain-containing protein n=1 Tax=Mucilaginibacter ginkgonis TaxID=2682091 RepID=A0A6I4I4W0_9SPHI|nr:DUF5686 and carboxypeptidase-like regulatory domain-containing protein [Mucilaginibacter ginkgonis]QQL50787.1 carboxypeptidase-like regulatory domain-containing protein [Mucilaginibacter ginkgonis]